MANDKHVIFETNEEAEDDVAQQLVPAYGKKIHTTNPGCVAHNKHINIQ